MPLGYITCRKDERSKRCIHIITQLFSIIKRCIFLDLRPFLFQMPQELAKQVSFTALCNPLNPKENRVLKLSFTIVCCLALNKSFPLTFKRLLPFCSGCGHRHTHHRISSY